MLGCVGKTSFPDCYSWCWGVLSQSGRQCPSWLSWQRSSVLCSRPRRGAMSEQGLNILYVGCTGGSPGSAPLGHCLGSSSKWSVSGILIRLTFISFTPVITWRLTKQTLCSFGGKTRTSAISHALISSGNKNSKLSSDLKLLAWQPARRCH